MEKAYCLSGAILYFILNWLLISSSDTLQYCYVDGNALTRFPAKLSLFKNLEDVTLSHQTDYNSGIPFLPNGSYASTASIKQLDLSDCGIELIEPGAFSGNFNRVSPHNNTTAKVVFRRFQQSIAVFVE